MVGILDLSRQMGTCGQEFAVRVALLGIADLRGERCARRKLLTGKILNVEERLISKRPISCHRRAICAGLGTGILTDGQKHRSPRHRLAQRTKRPILAVDVPSESTVRPDRSVALQSAPGAPSHFFRRKPGHLLLPGRVHCGETTVADIGIPDSVLTTISPKTFVNRSVWQTRFPVPRVDGYKYARSCRGSLLEGWRLTVPHALPHGRFACWRWLVTMADAARGDERPCLSVDRHADWCVCDSPGDLLGTFLLAGYKEECTLVLGLVWESGKIPGVTRAGRIACRSRNCCRVAPVDCARRRRIDEF